MRPGSTLSQTDVTGDLVTPLRRDVWGHQLWTPPPASQGDLIVTAAWIASGLDVPADSSDA